MFDILCDECVFRQIVICSSIFIWSFIAIDNRILMVNKMFCSAVFDVYLLLLFCCHLPMRFNTMYVLNKQHNRHGNEFGLGQLNWFFFRFASISFLFSLLSCFCSTLTRSLSLFLHLSPSLSMFSSSFEHSRTIKTMNSFNFIQISSTHIFNVHHFDGYMWFRSLFSSPSSSFVYRNEEESNKF